MQSISFSIIFYIGLTSLINLAMIRGKKETNSYRSLGDPMIQLGIGSPEFVYKAIIISKCTTGGENWPARPEVDPKCNGQAFGPSRT